ncbi:MAG: RNA 2',3'-cyclic phosphodiesterase [Pseudomonadota bacterium]
MPRLFAGLELPDAIRDDLAGLDMPLPGTRWVDWDDLHLTLRFIGDVDRATAEDFASYLEDIDADALQITLSNVGVFTQKDPKSLWVGADGGEALNRLARLTERAARNAGLPAKPHAFKPHVTLARLRAPDPARLARYLQKFARFKTEPFLVTHFSLFSARPKVGGGPYVVENAYPLLGGLSRGGLAMHPEGDLG